jgi:gluconolactonase
MQNGVYGIVEGPVWVGAALYVSEIGPTPNPPPSRILQVTPAGAVSVALSPSGSNGLAVDRAGNLYAAVHADGSISRVDIAAGKVTPIVSSYMGKRFDSPNDLSVRSDGNIYFSDPDYQAPNPAPQTKTRLYRIASGASTVTVVDESIDEPNGVTLSIDENTLYVTYPTGLYTYPVMADGSVGAGTLFSSITSGDGMAIDCAGNLYVATKTDLDVLDPTGKQIGQFALTGIQSVTNAAFGGADRKTLYITALGNQGQKGLFSVPLSIPGMPY